MRTYTIKSISNAKTNFISPEALYLTEIHLGDKRKKDNVSYTTEIYAEGVIKHQKTFKTLKLAKSSFIKRRKRFIKKYKDDELMQLDLEKY